MAPAQSAGPAVFEVGSHVVHRGEVRAFGDLRDAFVAEARSFRDGESALRRLADRGGALDEEDVERRINDLRYERRLLSADEVAAWLSARELDYDDLDAFARREAALSTSESGSPDAGPARESELTEPAYTAHLVVSRALGREAERLAVRLAALADEGGSLGDSGDLPARIGRAEDALRRRGTARLTPDERERRLRLVRLDLTRVEVELLDVEGEDAAREAILCLRDDGLEMKALAAQTGARYVRTQVFLEDLAEEHRPRMLSAAIGSVLEPFTTEGRLRVARLLGKREPSLDDADVVGRIDRTILDAFEADLLARRVRWLLRDEVVE